MIVDTLGNTSGTNSGDQLVFSTIAVSGQDSILADSTTDTLTKPHEALTAWHGKAA